MPFRLRPTIQLVAVMFAFVGFVENQNYPALASISTATTNGNRIEISGESANTLARTLGYAKQKIEHDGTFVPFGTVTFTDGATAIDSIRDTHRDQTNLDIASSLIHFYHQAAFQNKARATAVAYDAVIPNEAGKLQHAIAVLYDDRARASIRVYYPYTVMNNHIAIFAPRIFPGGAETFHFDIFEKVANWVTQFR